MEQALTPVDAETSIEVFDPALMTKVMNQVDTLESVLEQEFEALKNQDLAHLDRLLNAKNEILQDISRLTGVSEPAHASKLDRSWDGFRSRMDYCRNLHRRNEVLVNRKLDAIRGALKSLHITDPTSSVEVYDRLGKLNRVKTSRSYVSF